jgi:lysophospholipid acyltransferase (LPLAT)-like uncharacterized protein
MSINTKSLLTSEVFLSFLYRFIRIYSSTFHYSIINEKAWMDHLKQGGNVLLCAWHQQFFAAIHYFKTYGEYHPPLMISKSMDGAIIAGVARRCGWNPILGSSSRGGAEALKGMIDGFRESHLAGHVVDGPRGPAGNIKSGIIRLAHAADAVIVPFYTFADRSWYFNSWDNFLLPKPFARVTLSYDTMIKFKPTNDPVEFETQRQQLEKIMTPGLQGRLATKVMS